MPRRYPAELRRQVVDLARSGTRVAQLSETFGMTEATIYGWVNQEKVDRGEVEGQSTEQALELKAAKRRIRQLETELAVSRKVNQVAQARAQRPRVRRAHRPAAKARHHPAKKEAAADSVTSDGGPADEQHVATRPEPGGSAAAPAFRPSRSGERAARLERRLSRAPPAVSSPPSPRFTTSASPESLGAHHPSAASTTRAVARGSPWKPDGSLGGRQGTRNDRWEQLVRQETEPVVVIRPTEIASRALLVMKGSGVRVPASAL
jgi:transposase